MSMALEDPKPPESVAYSEWAEAEGKRRENAERMEDIESVGEMMATRALPPASSESGEE